eukprot:4784521-Alexandrium_andersonii.AAC.1
MCIRDRPPPRPRASNPAWLHPFSEAHAAGCGAGRASATPLPSPVPASVSYTHLTLPTICSV